MRVYLKFYLNSSPHRIEFSVKIQREKKKKSELSKFLTAEKTGQFFNIGWSNDENMVNNLRCTASYL